MVQIERVTEGCILGEAPHWDVATKSLYFVDIFGRSILRYVPSAKKITKASLAPKAPSFIIPVEGKKNEFAVGLDNELVIISWDGESSNVSIIEKLAAAEKTPAAPNKAFNDAKCDSSGRLWAGTQNIPTEIAKTEPVGTLYTYGKKQLEPQLEGIRIANGLAFNDKTKKMFYIDSMQGTVDQFDFDVNNGTISDRKVWFTVNRFIAAGMPDGMTIDTDGNLWVALFGGKHVIKVDGHQRETLLETIELPAEQITSLAFGGPNLDELYATTGALEMENRKLPSPDNGATYKITETGAKGLPGITEKSGLHQRKIMFPWYQMVHKAETLMDSIEMPAQGMTSVAFGGPNLNELYVTSALQFRLD